MYENDDEIKGLTEPSHKTSNSLRLLFLLQMESSLITKHQYPQKRNSCGLSYNSLGIPSHHQGPLLPQK